MATFDPESGDLPDEEESPSRFSGSNPLARAKAPKGSIAAFVDRAKATIRAQRKRQQEAKLAGAAANRKGKAGSKKERQRAAAAKLSMKHRHAVRSAFSWVPRLVMSECALLQLLEQESAWPSSSKLPESSAGSTDGSGSDSDSDSEQESASSSGKAGWEMLTAVQHAGAILRACELVDGAAARIVNAFLAALRAANPLSALASKTMACGGELLRTLWRKSIGNGPTLPGGASSTRGNSLEQGPGEKSDDASPGAAVPHKLLAGLLDAIVHMLVRRATQLSNVAVRAQATSHGRASLPFWGPDGITDGACDGAIGLLQEFGALYSRLPRVLQQQIDQAREHLLALLVRQDP